MRLDKLRGFGPWFAFASPVLLILAGISAFLVLLVAVGNHGPGSPLPAPPDPPWYGAAQVAAVACFGLSLACQLIVALELGWIEHPVTNTPLTYVGLVAAATSVLAYLLLLPEQLLNAGNLAFTDTWFFIVAGAGTYLVVMNFVGLRAGLLGPALPWIGIASGGLLVLVALSDLVSWPGVALVLLAAVLLYMTWSVWLGFRLRRPAVPVAEQRARE